MFDSLIKRLILIAIFTILGVIFWILVGYTGHPPWIIPAVLCNIGQWVCISIHTEKRNTEKRLEG
jgi:hypothetical protein